MKKFFHPSYIVLKYHNTLDQILHVLSFKFPEKL